MRRCLTLGAADWLVHSATPFRQLATFGPQSFNAYARVRFTPDPAFDGQREADVIVSEDHPSNTEVARRALRHLAPFTSTADTCYFCVWDGWGRFGELPEWQAGPLVSIPDRRYALFTGSLSEVAGWEQIFSYPLTAPAFVWPTDRRWCFASDIDAHWAGVGGDAIAIDSLVTAPDVDAVLADPTQPPMPYA